MAATATGEAYHEMIPTFWGGGVHVEATYNHDRRASKDAVLALWELTRRVTRRKLKSKEVPNRAEERK